MLRPLLLAAALLAPAAAASLAWAQSAPTAPLPPASSAPAADTPPSVSGDAGGPGRYGRMNMSPEMRQARQAMMQACSADFVRLCADADGGTEGAGGGRGARMQCLRQHMPETSDGCRSAMQAMRAARQGASTPPAPQPPAASPG